MAWSEAEPQLSSTQQTPAPYELLDDGFAPDPCDLLVIGCGNILRGDDAVGPVLVRTLMAQGAPEGVRVVDGGTAGMDVAFGMRGAARVVIVDAAATGAESGTVYRVPAEELAQLPPIDGLHTHNFRWDHALSFSAWLLGPHKPTDVTVFLIEGASYEPGGELSAPVEAGMRQVMSIIETEFFPEYVELSATGYLTIGAAVAAKHFPADVLVARMDEGDLWLLPLQSAGNGGLVLKQRNAQGDRSLLIHEVLDFVAPAGKFKVEWVSQRGALRVHLGRDAVRSTANGGDR